ncbi:hypothetical protein ACWDR0_15500 [Streptomyces sp. NPDC003691]
MATAVLQEDALNTLVADPSTTLEQLGEWIAESPDGPADGPADEPTGEPTGGPAGGPSEVPRAGRVGGEG